MLSTTASLPLSPVGSKSTGRTRAIVRATRSSASLRRGRGNATRSASVARTRTRAAEPLSRARRPVRASGATRRGPVVVPMRGSTTRRRADEDDGGGDGEVEASATGGAEGSDDAGEPTEVEVEEEESDAKEADREPSEDEETSEEIEQREREEQSAARAVSRRVFGGEADDRAIVVTRSLFAFGAFCIACAFVPKVVGLLCSYFEPLDTAVTAFEALTSNVGLDLRIMRATSTATFKVVALCVVITGLMREGKLPLETPVVVSKLAFNVMLPAYLCTRVAATLYLSPLTKALAVLPMSAMAQVIFGAFIGVGVTAIVNKIFAYTAAAHKEDMEDEELLEVEKKERDMSRLGIAACSFGNTFTLPLVFLTEVLGRARADETAGYIALYLIGWTPVLWTVGFLLIAGPVAVAGLSESGEKKDAMRDAYLTARATMVRISKELLNPPLLGIIAGVLIGATPLKEIFVGNFTEATTDFPMLLSFISIVFRSLFELAASIGAAALPGQMLVLASSLVKITPEDVEKRIARAKKEKVRAATNRDDDEDDDDDVETRRKNLFATTTQFVVSCVERVLRVIAGTLGRLRGGFAYLFRLDVPDARALAAACIVRFIALPAACLFGLLFLRALNSPWFPSDPSAALVLLTMSCMPAAQNLVLLTQLREQTRPLAQRLAALMLRQYVFAIVPVTFWLTAFTNAVV